MSIKATEISKLTKDIINIFADETGVENHITPDIAKKTYKSLNEFLIDRLAMSTGAEDIFRQLFDMQKQFDQRGQDHEIKDTLLGLYNPYIPTTVGLRYGGNPKFKHLPKETRVVLLMSALIGEAKETQEALGLLPEFGAKWWKKNIDWELVKEELMDCLHFLLSAFLNARMTPEEVFKRYNDKWKTNFERQDNDY